MRKFVFLMLLALPSPALAYMHILTEQITLTTTPVEVGISSGRLCLTVKNRGATGTASVFCGPHNVLTTEYWELEPKESFTWGANYKEQFSAQTRMLCYAASGTQEINISEEGTMPDPTPTPTP